MIIDKILISNDGCIESVPKTIYILDYKSKSFESADIDCSNNKSYEEIYYCYCKSITETFYKLKDWELPKERKIKKITDLKKGEYFKFKNRTTTTFYKFICFDEKDIVVRVYNKANKDYPIDSISFFNYSSNDLVEIINIKR